ncbi:MULTISPECIES: hypothetical protein [unclassified Shewanella]|uniref:hypothetical protein n=1 Tax=unclassified Shewanella TaxID=196818 RepID=UPI00156790FB|nr:MULTISPECIES: hypothetical protein [unclassified Shewanella]MCU8002528.1 hypothetical protein [Shewanella sp. SM96]MCU8039552.1 hypothetical protein [Shewanella sp. SM69]MCU8062158.1 hypothetical protein [Shewanella sp. SM55]MCU8087391.1 hypothetical protein [Shewanella sp. SM21]NRD34295.1 hypothetical protein [Shewanella sp. DC2-4]
MSINGVSGLQPQWTLPSTTENAPLKTMQPVANESKLAIADRALASLDVETGDVTTLLMVAAQQKQVVMAMAGQHSEAVIASALATSIEGYGSQLDIVNKWTSGGKPAFEAAIMQMFTAMKEGGINGIEYENMFQLVLLDVLSNSKEYGLEDANFLKELGTLLEKTGSGSHTNWDFTPEQLGAKVNNVWSTLNSAIQGGKIPTDSIAYQAMSAMSGGNISSTTPTELSSRFTSSVYNDPNAGGWITSGLNDISPMARIVLLSALNGDQTVSAAEVETILTGSKAEVDGLLTKLANMDAMAYLFSAKCPGWQNSSDTNKPLPPGVTQAFDYDGTIQAQYLTDLYKNFSPRQLTDEDIKEINRIGDQVKMLQQTLKYWIQVCRDEQMAFARNI